MSNLKDKELKKSHRSLHLATDGIKELLAQYLGLEPEDISDDDSLVGDLHMSATDLTDFVETLGDKGIDTSPLDLPNIETVSDLIESLISEELLT